MEVEKLEAGWSENMLNAKIMMILYSYFILYYIGKTINK